MIQITLTPEQLAMLDEATETVEIVDGRGQVFAKLECGFSEAEIAEAGRRAANFQSGGEFGELIQRTSESFSAGHPAKDSMNSIETC